MTYRANIRDGREHALIHSEEKIRDSSTANGRLSQGVHEAKVGQISNEPASGVREREGESPEEPLKRDHASGHH